MVIQSISMVDTQTAVAFVTFDSTQAASQGPNGDTSDSWTLDYTMKLVDGRWLIDRVLGQKGSTHTPG